MTLTFVLYSLLIVAASLMGGWVPMMVRLTHRRLQFATSLIAGFMLGVALLHLLPHALIAIDPLPAMFAVLAGLLAMFFLERFFHFHQHIAPGEEGKPPVTADPEPQEHCDDEPGHPIDHHHGHSHSHHDHHHHGHTHARLSWVGVSLGLLIHSLIGGAALAAAMAAEVGLHDGHDHATHAKGLIDALPGLAVFLVIVLHRPFDAMTLLTLLRTTGWPRGLQHIINIVFALMVPLGGVLMFMGLGGEDIEHSTAVGYALAAAAGVFLCVSLADLLPEVHFHQHDRVGLSVSVLLGLGLAMTIAFFEADSHAHEAGHGLKPETEMRGVYPGMEEPDHHDHDH